MIRLRADGAKAMAPADSGWDVNEVLVLEGQLWKHFIHPLRIPVIS